MNNKQFAIFIGIGILLFGGTHIVRAIQEAKMNEKCEKITYLKRVHRTIKKAKIGRPKPLSHKDTAFYNKNCR